MSLSNIKAVVSDMDGVLWRGMQPLAGLVPFFDFMRDQQLPFVLATNNSGRHPDNYVQKLAGMDVHGIKPQHIVSSGTATVDYLKAHFSTATPLFVIGNEGLFQMLDEAGFTIDAEAAQIVVIGVDFDFTYEKARTATLLIRAGAQFIGTNPDLTFPAPEGLVPGAGSVIKMIEVATDVRPTMIGKPEAAMFEVALERLGTAPHETLMIGDRLNTDIEGAAAVGLQTAMVLTGVSQREEVATSPVEPNYIFEGLIDLVAQWKDDLA